MKLKNLSLCLISGLLFGLSWPTYGFTPLIFIALLPLLWASKLINDSVEKQKFTFFYFFISFLIFNGFTSWWLWNASVFGMFFAVVVNALLMTTVFYAYHRLNKIMKSYISGILLCCFWICFEKFHNYWDFSWPWLHLGNVFTTNHKWIQWYEYTGVFGGTLWIITSNIFLFYVTKKYHSNKNIKALALNGLLPFFIIVVPIGISYKIYNDYRDTEKTTHMVVVQPNIDPYTEKYKLSNNDIAKKIINLSEQFINEDTHFVVAPETTLAELNDIKRFSKSSAYHTLFTFQQSHKNLNIIAGTTLYKKYNSKTKKSSTAVQFDNTPYWYELSNTAVCIKPNYQFETYKKSKLVVGVESIPYRPVLKYLIGSFMIDLGGDLSTLTPQKERAVFVNKGIAVAPVVCYESVYGEFVTEYVKKGAQALCIITNDGWWKNTEGHRQHLNLSRLRAIETRRAIARSANTGISAFINAKGDIEQFLAYEKTGSIAQKVKLNNEYTYYVKNGDYLFNLSLFTATIFLLGHFTRRRGKA